MAIGTLQHQSICTTTPSAPNNPYNPSIKRAGAARGSHLSTRPHAPAKRLKVQARSAAASHARGAGLMHEGVVDAARPSLLRKGLEMVGSGKAICVRGGVGCSGGKAGQESVWKEGSACMHDPCMFADRMWPLEGALLRARPIDSAARADPWKGRAVDSDDRLAGCPARVDRSGTRITDTGASVWGFAVFQRLGRSRAASVSVRLRGPCAHPGVGLGRQGPDDGRSSSIRVRGSNEEIDWL